MPCIVSLFLLEVCQEWRFKKGGTWGILRVPDKRLWEQDHPWCDGLSCLTLRKILRKFYVNIFVRSVSRRGVKNGVYLEDIEGSWPVNWRTGSSLILWLYLVDPKDHILKVLCCYLYCLLSYNGFLIKLLTSERREEKREERQVILVVTLPNATIGQKAAAGQGLPNKLIYSV